MTQNAFPLPRFSWRTLAIILASLTLSACSTMTNTTGSGSSTPKYQKESNQAGQDPLLDAPMRATMTCTSVEPVTVLHHFNDVLFAYPDIGVSVSVEDMRDAGWRVLSTDIGEDKESDNHVGFPVSIKVRKLF